MTAVRDKMEVELTFNNRQFEQGVRQSTESLNKFKSSVDLGSVADSFKNLGSSVKGVSFSGFSSGAKDVRVLGSAIEEVSAKTNQLYNLFGTITGRLKAMTIDKVANKIKDIFVGIPKQIISGGMRRAQNIEQAQFQLKGLLKNEYDWKKISDDIDFAVSGTRYGLDAAAKVAAQLSASNISFGDEMKSALRGISGVAAMTNSEYEDIGHIFTTIAGQGKVMTQQLNQFAGRGLNVAATLAEYYKTDEATLREMVTKGKVDFKSFADAMNKAFGEQATKANDTFSGALSNVKASLSRMGAQFMTPAYEELRKVLVMLIPVFKDIEKFIKPVSAGFEELAQTISKFAVDTLRDIHFDFLDMLGAKGTGFSSQISAVQNVLDNLRKSADETLKVEAGTADPVSDEAIAKQKESVDLYQKALEVREEIEASAKKKLEAGEDEALVLREQQIAFLELDKMLNEYEESTKKTVTADKKLTDQQKKYIDATTKATSATSAARDKYLSLYATEMEEAKLLSDNTEARKTYSEIIEGSTEAAVKQASTMGSSLLGLESGDFGKSIKIVTSALKEVGNASDSAFEFDSGKKVDHLKKITTQADKSKKVYEAFETAMSEINKTAEEYIKAGKDETEVNKQKEEAIKALKSELAAFDEQNKLSLDIQDKSNKGREVTSKLYDNAKKAVSGVSDKVLKLFGIEKDEGEQISKNAKEYQGLEEIAADVILGKYGNGEERKQALEDLGLSYAIIQNKVNELLGCEKRYAVTAEDEAKMAKYLGTSLSETGEEAKKSKTTFEKLLDVLAGIGAAINIVKEAGTAVVNNLIRPFLSWALPKVFDAILSALSPIGEKLVALNEKLHDSDFFNVKTKELAEWFIHLKDTVVEFWSKAKELEGVKKLQEAFERLKNTLSDIGGKIFGKIKEGFEAAGDQANTIFTMENLLKVVDSIATALAKVFDFISEHKDDIANAAIAVLDVIYKVEDAIVAFFKDPIGSINKFSDTVKDALSKAGNSFSEFFTQLKVDPKATAAKILDKFIYIFGQIKKGLANGLKDFLAGDKVYAADGLVEAIDTEKVSAGLFQKAKDFVMGFVNAIREFFSEGGLGGTAIEAVKNFVSNLIKHFDIKKGLAIGGLGVFALIVKKIFDFISSITKAVKSIKDIPGKFVSILGGVSNTLNATAMQIKADALIKIAGAIAIFAVALVALSFIDTDRLLGAAGAMGIVMGALAAVIAAISLYKRAQSMAASAGAASAKDKALTNVYMSVSNFLTGMKQALQKALKLTSMGVFMVSLAIAVGILVGCLKVLTSIDWEKDGYTAAKGLAQMILVLVAAVALVSKFGSNFKAGTGAGIKDMALSLLLIVGVIKLLTMFKSDELSAGIAYLAVLLTILGLFTALMSWATKSDKSANGKQSEALGKTFKGLGLALLEIVAVIKLLTMFNESELSAGITYLGIILGVLVAFTFLMTKATETKKKIKGGNPLQGLAKMILGLVLLVPALLLLGAFGMTALKGIGLLAAAIGVLVGAAVLVDKFAAKGFKALAKNMMTLSLGILVLGPALVVLGASFMILGEMIKAYWQPMVIGFLAFAAALAVIGAIATKFAVGFAAISLPLVALVGIILAFVLAAGMLPGVTENLKGFFENVTGVLGGIASGIGSLFGIAKEKTDEYVTAVSSYKNDLSKLDFLTEDVKTELTNRFKELEHLDGSEYTIGLQNVLGYIEGLDLTHEQIQTLLNTTMADLKKSAVEQFSLAFDKVKADIGTLGLDKKGEQDLLDKVKALASTVPGEFQTELASLKTKIYDIVPDPTAAARIYSLAVNAAKAEAVYKTVMDKLEIYLTECGLSDQAKEKIKTSISNITTAEINSDGYVTLSDIKLQIEQNELGLDEFQQTKLNSMVDAAIKAGTTANLLMDSIILAIEDTNGVKLSDPAKAMIRATIEEAAQLSLTNPNEAKTKINNLVLELGQNYGWSKQSQALLGGMLQKAFEAKSLLNTKLNSLSVYTNNLGLTEKNDAGLTFAEQVSKAVNGQTFPPIELENIWFEVKNSNMSPEKVAEVYTQIGDTINAAVNKNIALNNLKIVLDTIPGISDTDKDKIIDEIKKLENLSGTERSATVEAIVNMVYELADDTPEAKAAIQIFLDDLGIYELQAEDFKAVTIESMKLAIEGVEWGEDKGHTKQDFIDKIEEMAKLSGAPLKAAVENFIIALNNDPTIPGDVKTSLEEQARGLVDIYTTAYDERLTEFYEREAKRKRNKYIGSFIVGEDDKGNKITIKNGSEAAKGVKEYFENAEEVTDEALNEYADHIEELIHSGDLSLEDFLSGFEGYDKTDEELANMLFPEGTSHSIDPAAFRELVRPLIEAYISGASEEFKHRLKRDDPDKYNFDQWLMDRFTTKTPSGKDKVNYEAIDQISADADEFLAESEDAVRAILGKYDGEITLTDILTALYGKDEGIDKGLQSFLTSEAERVMHDLELLETIWNELEELRKDPEFNEETFFAERKGTGEELAKLTAQDVNEGFSMYYNLDPAKKAVVDGLFELMHPGEEIDPETFYEEITGIFNDLGLRVQEFTEDGEWIDIKEMTLEDFLGSDNPFKFLYDSMPAKMRTALIEAIPGLKENWELLIQEGMQVDTEELNEKAEEASETIKDSAVSAVEEAAEGAASEAESKTESSGMLDSLVEKLLTGGTEEGGVAESAMDAIKEGLEKGDFDTDELTSILTDKLTNGEGDNLDLSGLFGDVDLSSVLGEDFSIGSLVNSLVGKISTGDLDITSLQTVGSFLTGGLGEGMLSNLGCLTDAIGGGGGIVETILGAIKNLMGVESPSTVMAEIGGYLNAGLALGLTNTTSKIVRAMTHAVSIVLLAIKTRIVDFNTYGYDSGTAYATGISNTSVGVGVAARLLAVTAEHAVKERISEAETIGEDWGKGFVKGVESQIDEARAAGRKIGEATEQGEREATLTSSPSRVAMKLGNYFGMGYVIGLEEYTKKAGQTGKELGDKTIDALKTPMMIINDILNTDMDSSPVITPVLDLSNIQNGARTINGLIPSEARSLGYLSYSMGNRREMTNADVVSAIMGLPNQMESTRGDTYNINGVTYDDGSNIVDAVQTLVRAARIERRR